MNSPNGDGRRKGQPHFEAVRYIVTGSGTEGKQSRKWKSRHLLRIGYEYLNSKRYAEAIAYFQKSIMREPDLPTTYNALGYAMLLQAIRHTEVTESIPLFTKAIQLNPSYTIALYNRGVAYHKAASTLLNENGLKKSDESDSVLRLAVSDFTMCVKLDKFFAKAYHNRACCLALLRQSKKAAGDMTKSIILFDNESEIHKKYATGNYKINVGTNVIKNDDNDDLTDISTLSDHSSEYQEPDDDEEKTKLNGSHGRKSEPPVRGSATDWERKQKLQQARNRLHRVGTSQSARKDLMKSLHSRQLIHEKRVETEEAEKDRELVDNLKIEIDHYNDVPGLGEQESRSRGILLDSTKQKPGDIRSNTSTTAYNGTSKDNNNVDENAQIVGKMGSLIVKRKKR